MIHSFSEKPIQKILIVTLSNIGDVILTTPVISALREKYPQSFISVAVGPKAVSLFQGCHTVNEVLIFDKKAPWLQIINFVFELRKKRFDLVVDLRNTAIPLLLTPRYRTSIFNSSETKWMREKHLSRIHFVTSGQEFENHFDFYSETEKQNALAKARQAAGGSLRSFVLIAPGARSWLKRWTADGFAEVAQHFLNEGKDVILTGDTSEAESILDVQKKVGGKAVVLTGTLSLRELAGLISLASLVISNDSAIMHFAHELNRPTVSVFGPTDEIKYAGTGANRKSVRLQLDCTPCEKAECALPRRICLDDLPASQVIRAAQELLHVSCR